MVLSAGLHELEPNSVGQPLSAPLSRVRAPTWARPKASVLHQQNVAKHNEVMETNHELDEGNQ